MALRHLGYDMNDLLMDNVLRALMVAYLYADEEHNVYGICLRTCRSNITHRADIRARLNAWYMVQSDAAFEEYVRQQECFCAAQLDMIEDSCGFD